MLNKEADIAEIARLYGVTLRTLRFYEEKGLMSPFRQGLTRIYRKEDRVRLDLIVTGKRLGFSLSQIRELLDDRRTSAVPEAKEDGVTSILDRMSRNQVQQQLMLLERQRNDVLDAIETLRQAVDVKHDDDGDDNRDDDGA